MINVLNRLQADLSIFGTCTMTIVDTTDLFVIERHDPFDMQEFI